MHSIRFRATLSNGEIIEEEKDYKREAGQITPYVRLQNYMQDNSLNIVSISLVTEYGQEFRLPSQAKTPKFRAFADCLKPESYGFMRLFSDNVQGKKDPQNFTVIEAIYTDKIIQLWVDEQKPHNSYVLYKAVNQGETI